MDFSPFGNLNHVWRVKAFEENRVKLSVRSSLSLKDFLSRVLLYKCYSSPEIPIVAKTQTRDRTELISGFRKSFERQFKG